MRIPKEAIVVGGSNGIGLAISKALASQGRHVHIVDKVAPDIEILKNYTYHFCDLLKYNKELIETMAQNNEADTLFITAGFGRVADFEYLDIDEIEKLFQINAVAAIKIIRQFYNRIHDDEKFYCGMMGSISGLVCSPMFSVYAATKAAVCRFIESVNIELEANGFSNRILNVSPGSMKGTKFNGEENDLDLLKDLTSEILKHLWANDELYIPEYDEIYKGVIASYKSDPHTFGLSSYKYKERSGRATNRVI